MAFDRGVARAVSYPKYETITGCPWMKILISFKFLALITCQLAV
jgi:hypothetical protein